MKYIFISDIHGKPGPLHRAFEMMESLAFDKVVCLGDIVGYGDEPNECIRLIRRNADIVLAGNHEYAVCQKRSWLTSNQRAIEGFLRTQILLSQSELNYLNELPLTHEADDLLFVHSTPLEPHQFRYPVLTPGGMPATEPFQAVQDIFRAIDSRVGVRRTQPPARRVSGNRAGGLRCCRPSRRQGGFAGSPCPGGRGQRRHSPWQLARHLRGIRHGPG